MSIDKEVQLPNGRMWLSIARGEVVGQTKWSETEVRASGGGGFVSQQGGYVAPPVVSSTAIEKHEFWIRDAAGKERAVKLTDRGFSVREGQKVWVAWGNNVKNGDSGPPLFAVNHASGETRDFIGNWRTWLWSSGLLRAPFAYRLLTTWLPLLLALCTLLVWLPAASGHPLVHKATTISQYVTLVSDIANPNYVMKHWPPPVIKELMRDGLRHETWMSIAGLALAALALLGVIWVGIMMVAKFLGNVFFLRDWGNKQAATIRDQILKACQSGE